MKSVAAQQFEAWEHWIIDSVSTDKTLQIAQLAAENDARVHVISELDCGVYDAMNKAIPLARGEWIYFLGADDELFDLDVLSTMLNQDNCNSDFLYGNVLLIPEQKVHDGPFDVVKLLSRNICHQAIFYRRAVFDQLGSFDLRFPIFADWEFNIRCMLDPNIRTKHVETLVARFHTGGISFNGTSKDPGWHNERVDMLGRQFNLDQRSREILRSVVEELIRQTFASGKFNPWRDRYDHLLRVHNNLLNSSSYRIISALTRPAKTMLRAFQRERK